MQEFTYPTQFETKREIDLGTNKLYISKEDPYGFWRLSLHRGGLPKEFSGVYTGLLEAEKAAQKYIAERKQVKAA